MNKKEYFILFILAMIFGLGIYFYFSKNIVLSPVIAPIVVAPEQEVKQESGKEVTEQIIYIKDWKIYQNKKYGFEIQYPDYWKASGKTVRDNFVSFIDEVPSEETPDAIEFSIEVITDKKYVSLDSYLKEQDNKRATAWEGKPSISIRSSEKIKINGIEAIRREIYNNAAGFPSIETFVLKDSVVYALSIDLYTGEIVLGRSRLYDKVIGTFRFTK